MDLSQVVDTLTGNVAQSLMLALCVVLLIVLLAKEGFDAGSGSASATGTAGVPHVAEHSHTGASCGCSNAVQEHPEWTDDAVEGLPEGFYDGLPVSAYWPLTAGQQKWEEQFSHETAESPVAALLSEGMRARM